MKKNEEVETVEAVEEVKTRREMRSFKEITLDRIAHHGRNVETETLNGFISIISEALDALEEEVKASEKKVTKIERTLKRFSKEEIEAYLASLNEPEEEK